jgi:hypothetical protein
VTYAGVGVLGALGGTLGVLVAVAAESDAQPSDGAGLVDPAQAISRQLSLDLEHHYGLRHAKRPILFDSDDETTIRAADPSADVVIDIWTERWSLVELSEDLSKLHLHYAANMRLIDARTVHALDGKTGLVIAEGTCERSPEGAATAATRDQLLADGARRLKAELAQAVQGCIHDFRSQLLNAP